MGSAGGVINSNKQVFGGTGGGIVILIVGEIENNGRISVNGQPGQHTHHQASGGGAGGSIFIYVADIAKATTGTLEAQGGAGGVDPNECSYRPTGGSGSEGRILITHSARFGAR